MGNEFDNSIYRDEVSVSEEVKGVATEFELNTSLVNEEIEEVQAPAQQSPISNFNQTHTIFSNMDGPKTPSLADWKLSNSTKEILGCGQSSNALFDSPVNIKIQKSDDDFILKTPEEFNINLNKNRNLVSDTPPTPDLDLPLATCKLRDVIIGINDLSIHRDNQSNSDESSVNDIEDNKPTDKISDKSFDSENDYPIKLTSSPPKMAKVLQPRR